MIILSLVTQRIIIILLIYWIIKWHKETDLNSSSRKGILKGLDENWTMSKLSLIHWKGKLSWQAQFRLSICLTESWGKLRKRRINSELAAWPFWWVWTVGADPTGPSDSRIWIYFDLNHSIVALAACLWLLSCWSKKHLPLCWRFTAFSRFSSSIALLLPSPK